MFRNAIAADIAATITTGYFVPLQPVNLAVTIGDSSAALSWSPPTSNGGLVITDYVIEYKLSSGGVWSVFADGVSTDTNTTVTSLANDNSYDFRVSAVNAVGQGPASAMVSITPGSPAQVIVLGFSDLTIPSITTGVRITNEGAVAYEYQYNWCITNSNTNLCGGGDDIFSASAAKLIQPSENWDTNLNTTVSSAGTYWFHVSVSFGSDTSYASQSFTATVGSSSGGGGGGGGGGSRRSNRPQACVGADLNNDKKVSLVDFSILMVFFGKNPPFKNPCADINLDGKVNMVDFSILLNQWGKKPVLYK
ncbi:MAG: fibronectin type III domain-containing protein [Candidatus Pacebacteria bacterium]|nr:fibronectin type III domain-containing protein [Candidatus Paceibacterota bacterium]MBP9842376.1 fibronectin type III domain-containing protein [Candidatus Paceibacterota bacterium]